MPYTKNTALVTSFVSAMALVTLACAEEAELDHIAAEESQSGDVYAEQAEEMLDQDITTEDLVTETQGYEAGLDVEIPADELASATEVVLTKEDTIALSVAKFSAADADSDGTLTQDEFVAMTVSMSQTLETELIAPPAADIVPGESMPEDVVVQATDVAAAEAAATAEVTETATAQFAQIAEEENSVTQEKVVAAIIASFDKADTDGDDLIEGEELIKFAELTKKGDASEEL